MSYSNNNPFVRGYDGLSVQRLLAISYDDDCPLTYLPLHPSQSNLPDSQVERRACIFSDDFVLITEDQVVPNELQAQCRSHGLARNVVYAVMAEEEGKPLHVGDTYSEESAREVVQRLRRAGAVIASGAILGPIIPPSTNFILLGATVSGLSITKLFMIGLVPGILIGLALMVVWFFVVRKDGYNETIRFTKQEAIKILIDSTPAFMMPVLLLGGIRFGIFTPTEGGAFAAIYAILVCVLYYRELSFRDLLRVSARAARTTSVVMLIVATATAVGWFITIAQIPNQMTALFSPLIDSPILLLISINIFLFLIGMVMDLTPNILIFAPVFYPLIQQAGIDPYYFGLLFVLNLGIGVITPPVGTVLYVVCGIGHIKFADLIVKLIPFVFVETLMLFLLLFFPKLSLVPMNWLMGGN